MERCLQLRWELADTDFEAWTSGVAEFLAHVIRETATEYAAAGYGPSSLHVYEHPEKGVLEVIPSPGELVHAELASGYQLAEFRRINTMPEGDAMDEAFEAWGIRTWSWISECLVSGPASRELAQLGRSRSVAVVGYLWGVHQGPRMLRTDGTLAQEGAGDD
jgi:hypothetical protein